MSLVLPTPVRWLAALASAALVIGILTFVKAHPMHTGKMALAELPDGPSGVTNIQSAGTGKRSTSEIIPHQNLPVLDEDLVMQGRYVFERQCMTCHGKWGDGRGELAKGMVPSPRKLTSGIFKFRSTPSGSLPTDRDLERTIRGGIANSSMPSFAHLPSRDVGAVIAYLKTLSSRWRHFENYGAPIPLPPEPDWFYDQGLSKPHVDSGAALFQANCAACHGAVSTELLDLWGEPCPAPSFEKAVLKCGGEPMDLFRILSTGMDGTPMPSFQHGLTEAERWEVVAFMNQIRSSKRRKSETVDGN